MAVILDRVFFFVFLLIILIGTGLKIYTKRRLSDIDGFSPIIRQDMEQEHIIGEFGEKS